MIITCPNCLRKIELLQKGFYHAGFSNLGFLYCNTCTNILEFSSFNINYTRIVGNKHPWMLDESEKAIIERHLAPCPCEGRFSFNAYPRCPFCKGSLSSIIPDTIHFLEIGDVIDGDNNRNVWLMNTPDIIL